MPSFRSEWFWWDWQGAKDKDVVNFMQENYKPDFTYADFAKQFTAEFYDAARWADIFNASGAGSAEPQINDIEEREILRVDDAE